MSTAIAVELDALCLLLLCTVAYQSEKNLNQQKGRVLFRATAYGIIVQLVLDILWLLVEGRIFPGAIAANNVINALYLGSGVIIGCVWYLYVLETLGYTMSRRLYALVLAPGVFFTLLNVVSIWTGWVFSVSPENTYAHGPLFWLQSVGAYGIIAVSFLHIIAVLLSRRGHEIRTPMNAIIGLDNIALRHPDLPEETRSELEKIGSSARHLLSLINDILDMSRIESGRMELKHEPFSLREVTEQINTIINGQCEDKRLTYESRMEGLADDWFTGDALRLRQVLINILGNAVKFTDAPGTVTFTVAPAGQAEDRPVIRFTVKDTGVGMDEAFLPRLFEAFSQEDATITNRYGGSGLGMALTKNMVGLMGGTIAVESEKGKGSTFTVDLPLARAERPAEAEKPAEAASPLVDLEGLHVLIAEDMELNAEVLADLLEMEGMTSEWAENGRKAVELFGAAEAGHFDFILMDMRMPVMDGLAATRAIRALDRPDAATIPIIALTANAFEEDVQQCLAAGMDAHLSKPVDLDKLKALLGGMLKKE